MAGCPTPKHSGGIAVQPCQCSRVREEVCDGFIIEVPPLPAAFSMDNEDCSTALQSWFAETLAAEQEAISQEMSRCHIALLASLRKRMALACQRSSLGQQSPQISVMNSPRQKARPHLPQLSPGQGASKSGEMQSPTSDSSDSRRRQAPPKKDNVISPKLDLGAQILGKAETAEEAAQKRRASGMDDSNCNSSTTLAPSVRLSESSEKGVKAQLSSAVERVRTTLLKTGMSNDSNNTSQSIKRGNSVNNFMTSIQMGSRQKRDVSNGLGFTLESDDDKVEVRWLYDFVSSAKFEMVMGGIIMLNAILLAVQMQYYGLGLGHTLEYRWYHRSAEQTWPGAVNSFKYLDYAFGVIFTLEIIVKVVGLRSAWVRDCWNIFDLGIILIWYAELLTTWTGQEDMPIKASFVRTARLARLQRLFKLVKTIQGFDDLYLMTTTLKGSVSVLAWSCLLLLLLQMLIALAINELLTAFYFSDPYYPLSERQEVFAYFGTFSRSMLTMFEMTLANWPPVCRLLQEYVNEWFVVFCVVHKLTIGFAVIGVINGVFMQETFSVAATDDRIMLNQRERQLRSETRKLLRLMRAADDSGDGFVDREEFKRITSFEEVKLWLGSMGLDVTDADAVFALVDVDADGQLSAQELVSGIAKLKGAARSIDMNMVMRQQRVISQALGCELNIPEISEKTGCSGGSKCESRHSLQSRLSVAFEGDRGEDEIEGLWREAGALPTVGGLTPRLLAHALQQ